MAPSITGRTHGVSGFSENLIFDIGMHRGADTEFYLRKGFSVLAVEANPAMITVTADRLHEYVDAGRLTILHLAVADHKGETEFYVSDREGWGSVLKDRALSDHQLRVGSHPVRVPCDTFQNILKNYGVPYYLKVDIEGSDALCIEALPEVETPPRYVSLECDLADPAQMSSMLEQLGKAGYKRFKLLNQARNPSLHCPYPAREGLYVPTKFTHYMSGPFGEETPGPWSTGEQTWDQYRRICREQSRRTTYAATGQLMGLPLGKFHRQLEWAYNRPSIRALRLATARVRRTEVGGWFDLHAAREEE